MLGSLLICSKRHWADRADAACSCLSCLRLAMLRRKMEGGGARAVAELRRREQELASLAQIERSSKRCPRCGMATQKAEGCNKVGAGKAASQRWAWVRPGCGLGAAGAWSELRAWRAQPHTHTHTHA